MNLRNCVSCYKQHVQRNNAVLHIKVVLFDIFHLKHHRVCSDIFECLAHHAPRNRARRTHRLCSKYVLAYFQHLRSVIHTCVLTLRVDIHNVLL